MPRRTFRPTHDQARARIRELIILRRDSAANISRRLKRSDRYLSAYLRSTDDARLPQQELLFIARYLGVPIEEIEPHDPEA